MKWWSILKVRWINSQTEIPSFYHDISDEDGYCTCLRCQEQKEIEIEQIKGEALPDDLFEL